MKNRILTFSAMGVLLTSLALYGCDTREQPTATLPETDEMAARPLPKFEGVQGGGAPRNPTAGDGAPQSQAPAGTDAAGTPITERAREMAQDVGDKVSDAVITATVKAELAKDDTLSALDIQVDTDDGRVALRGTAPDAQSRERATQLAAAVDGVVSVENQLRVESGQS